ncbi:MAG: hypothetical protein ACE5FJ_12250 [Gemmatimonadales bacterium]
MRLASRWITVLAVLALAFPDALRGQAGVDWGNSYVSFGAGITFGPKRLWHLPQQALANPAATMATIGALTDTLEIGQSIDPGTSFGFTVTRYLTAGVGIGLDFDYISFRNTQQCRVIFDSVFDDTQSTSNPNTRPNPNRSTCESIRSLNKTAVVLSAIPHLIFRFLPLAQATPYLKVGGGPAVMPPTARIRSPLRTLIQGPEGSTIRPALGFALGARRQSSIETQVHIEFRYLLHQYDVVTGPASLQGIAPFTTEWHRSWGFSMGLDFEL